MSWHGTLTCSYCYDKGHTRRKCPQMKKRHDEYQRHIDNGTQDDAEWYLRSAWREYKRQQETLDETKKVCNFCQETGHRVGTCPERLKRVDELKELDEWFIPIVLQVLDELGYGIGTVVRGSGYINDDYRRDIPLMVTDVHLTETHNLSIVNLWENHWARLKVTNMITMQETSFALPDTFRWSLMDKLWSIIGLPEGYDFSQPSWRQSDYTSENPVVNYLGWLGQKPNNHTFDYCKPVGAYSKPLPLEERLGWNYRQKREANRLFRDSKNKLVDTRWANKVSGIYKLLKKRGVL